LNARHGGDRPGGGRFTFCLLVGFAPLSRPDPLTSQGPRYKTVPCISENVCKMNLRDASKGILVILCALLRAISGPTMRHSHNYCAVVAHFHLISSLRSGAVSVFLLRPCSMLASSRTPRRFCGWRVRQIFNRNPAGSRFEPVFRSMA
jgi:hypothetical protein